MKKLYISVLACVLSIGVYAQNYAFTNATATGVAGPNQAQVNAAYLGTDLDGMVTVTGQGFQDWVVPTTGPYTINAAGASGGYTPNAAGGGGRMITVEVNLTQGDVIRVLVGQEGGRADFSTPGWCGGGGGGTFIINQTTGTPILICGGGGGAAEGNAGWGSPVLPGVDASAYNNQNGGDGTGYAQSWSTPGIGGTGGAGGGAIDGGSGGGGYLSDGVLGYYGGYIGISYPNGGLGGLNRDACSSGFVTDVPGGFGGGAGAGICSNYEANGGGGGGYSGGGGSNTRAGAGGGGGNFYTGNYVTDGLNSGNGYATITPMCDALITTVSGTNLCDGEQVTLSASAQGAGVITWDNGVVDGVAFTPPFGTTTYTATSSDGNDCSFVVNVTMNPNPTVNAGADITLCEGIIDTTLTATGVADSFTWNNGISDGVSFTPSMGITTYVVTAENIAGGCQATDTLVLMAGNPTISLASSDEMFGNDGSATLTINSGIPPFTFDWDNDGVGDNDDSNDLYNIPAGTYNVTMTDGTGCTTSATIVVGSQLGLDELSNGISIYPNPVKDLLTVEMNGEFYFEILSLTGETLMDGNGTDKSQIDLKNVASGSYFVAVTSNGNISTLKIVKQ